MKISIKWCLFLQKDDRMGLIGKKGNLFTRNPQLLMMLGRGELRKSGKRAEGRSCGKFIFF